MKKYLSLFLALIISLFVLVSCNEISTDTSTATNTDTQSVDTTVDTQKPTDKGTDTSTDTTKDTDTPDTSDDYYNEINRYNVTVSETDKKGNYYTKLNYYYVSNLFPNDFGEYIKIFNSLDELEIYADTKATEDLFKDNYVVAIRSSYGIGMDESEVSLGFYDLKCQDGYYYIARDSSLSATAHNQREALEERRVTDYIVVPKTEIEYFEDIKPIMVNHTKINERSFFYATTENKRLFLNRPTAFIVNREIANEIGLRVSAYEEMDYYNSEVLIVYIPKPKCDLSILDYKIENGNFYFNCEMYVYDEDTILTQKDTDAIFYEFYINTSSLSENFQVYANIDYVYLPNIPRPETKYASRVEIEYVDFDHALYSEVRNRESTDEEKYFFPEEVGSYFMLINSYEQMLQYFNTNEVTEETFENNYIMVLHRHYYDTFYGEREIAFRNLKYENGEYSITLNWFYEPGDRLYPEWVQEFFKYNYIIIPKTKIDYIEGIQNITVNYKEIKQTRLDLITSDNSAPTPEQNSAFIVNKDSPELYEYGLSKFYFDKSNSVLLYLDNFPEKEFIVTEVEIVGENLYITLDTYDHIEKDEYTSQIHFYNINVDTTQLNDRFTVYLIVYDWII